jgi:hypothetical protein
MKDGELILCFPWLAFSADVYHDRPTSIDKPDGAILRLKPVQR